jgi:hypothetical protein
MNYIQPVWVLGCFMLSTAIITNSGRGRGRNMQDLRAEPQHEAAGSIVVWIVTPPHGDYGYLCAFAALSWAIIICMFWRMFG